MHLPTGAMERIDDGGGAVDLGQTPGDIVFLSTADSELATFAEAARRRPGGPTIRLASPALLAHPLSVDLYLERTAGRARLVIVRLHGGAGYWPHGLESLRALARSSGLGLVVVPAEDRWNPDLEAYSTLPTEECRALWRYCVEGGVENAGRALALAAFWLGEAAERPRPVETVPRAGVYWPGEGVVSLDRVITERSDRPIVAIVFYRALLLGASTAPVDALVAALADRGLVAMPIFVPSLRDREAEALLAEAFDRMPPALVLNATAFSASRADGGGTALDRPGRPVLQVIFSGGTEAAWRASARGLGPQDLAMNVVLPEVDGRIGTRAVSFKHRGAPDPITEHAEAAYRPVVGRVSFVADLAAAWVRLGRKPRHERRVALILSNYPNRDGRIGNGVGLDTPASAVGILKALREAGYGLADAPDSSAALMKLLVDAPPPLPIAAPPPPTSTLIPRRPAQPGLEGSRQGFCPREETPGRPRPSMPAAPAPQREVEGGFAQGEQAANTNRARLTLAEYQTFFDGLPAAARAAVLAQWGEPEADPALLDGAFHPRVIDFGDVIVAVQPSRGYDVDPKATYHDPDLVPPHAYLAFYAWLRIAFEADAIVHLGKHGNLEWLPGKAVGLSEECWPEIALGAVPLIYPFIVNDPGEGSQAKRRSSAVIVDHLMPPMARAELHGPLARLEALVDEYFLAAGVDGARQRHLQREIVSLAGESGLDRDLGIAPGTDEVEVLRALDAHLCELKELQIRDGLHVLGASPAGELRTSTLVAIARAGRSGGRPGDASLHRAIADDLGLDLDPLDCDLAEEWSGPRPEILAELSAAPWRTNGDTVERIELLGARLVAECSDRPLPADGGGTGRGPKAEAVLQWIAEELGPALDRSGGAEISAMLAALDGRFVPPGPSGAPTRGRPEVLPTGRNFYSVDCRAVPTEAAWALGWRAAEALALRYFQDEGEWPRSIALSAWATSNMRTGGDDIAEALALVGAAPQWERGTGRVVGFRVLPLSELGRPRIDVTLRISGMFRDAFPMQVDLFDSAVRTVAALGEPPEANPIAAAVRASEDRLASKGVPRALAARQAATRIFGAKPGAYGAGLQALIDESVWESRSDFADAFLAWSSFAYGGGADGIGARDLLTERLEAADAVLHNQDNREHDILDSDDYYQFQGGLAATVETLKGRPVPLYYGDHARPERPVVRALGEEIARVVRGRAANPKWIAGVMRHGYKGAFEMAATVDYLFAFAATTDSVGSHHFDLLYDAYVDDPKVRAFLADANAPALREMAARFREAIERSLWRPARNSAYDALSALLAQARDAAE